MPPITNFRNERAQSMWSFISHHIDFTEKTVIDIGCGFGDFSLLAKEAGAKSVLAIDINRDLIRLFNRRKIGFSSISTKVVDIETYRSIDIYDIGFCFSLLPYLKDPDRLIKRMAKKCEICLFECQYYGDGPGLHFLSNDSDMKMWLLSAADFRTVVPIGKTRVDYRNMDRTIWLCSLQNLGIKTI